jgi:hypothetical protein
MVRRRLCQPLMLASCVVLTGLLAAPVGHSLTRAASQEVPRLMNKKPTMKIPAAAAPAPPPQVQPQAPTTLDDYIDYIRDKLQAEAMQIKTPGMAAVKLSIGKDGSIQQTEIIDLVGPAALRDQLTSMIGQVRLPPLPPAVNADVLIIDTSLAFNYPGDNMLDRLGWRSRSN